MSCNYLRQVSSELLFSCSLFTTSKLKSTNATCSTSTDTVQSSLHNYGFVDNRFIWVLAARGWSSSYKGTEKTKKHLEKLTINVCEQWETIKCKILYLGLHVSGSMDIASAFLMGYYSVQAAASTVTWCDELMPIQSVLLHQSALWDHLAFQKELLRSVSWKNVLQKSFNICLAEGDRKYSSLKNKEDNRKQKLIWGYSHLQVVDWKMWRKLMKSIH